MASKTENARRLIEEIEERLALMKELVGMATSADIPDLGDRVLAEVLERGASVSREELYEIAESQGMDRRGLGGFFRESGQKSLTDLPGIDRIVLTAYGAERAQRQLNRIRSGAYEPGEPNLARAAEPSFADDWNSDEDAAYDRL